MGTELKTESIETKKCKHCLKRTDIEQNRCPYCRRDDFTYDGVFISRVITPKVNLFESIGAFFKRA